VAGGCVFVATEGGSVYALSEATGALRWHTRLASPISGGLPCGDIFPSGITGTPVLDPAAGELFAVALTRGAEGPEHDLFALSAARGKVLWREDLSVPGRDQAAEQQRGALAIDAGNVYVPFGGLFGDCGNYAGAVASVPEAAVRHRPGWWEVPTARGAGIWEPGAPEVLQGGELLLADGNGAASPGESFDGSNAVYELTSSLRVAGYFAPTNWAERNESDDDLGSTAPAVLGGALALAIGKDGVGYLVSTSRLGGIGGQVASEQVCTGGGAFGSDAVSGDVAYVPCTGGVVAVKAGRRSLSTVWSSGSGGWGSLLFAGGRVFEETQGGEVLAFSAPSGKVLQQLGLAAPETHFPWVIGVGRYLFALDGQRVVAFSGL
jgi:polyvinyl alcohol dehydrogenase (cytochrome)